jgi:peptide chain release factor subunit 1
VASSGAEFLVVGGHDEIAPQFVPFLSPDLQSKVVDRVAIDTHAITPERVRARVAGVVTAFERREEQALVAQTFERAAAGGFAAVGLPWVLAAVDENAVQLLLIHDDDQVPGRVCDNCGWLGLDGDPCPVCDRPTRDAVDVIDEAAAAVIDAGGRVEHVYASTELADRHVAAMLRFPVARPVLASSRSASSGSSGQPG